VQSLWVIHIIHDLVDKLIRKVYEIRHFDECDDRDGAEFNERARPICRQVLGLEFVIVFNE
jgi:hypothetical protein